MPEESVPKASIKKRRPKTSRNSNASLDPDHLFSKHIIKEYGISTANSRPITSVIRNFLNGHINRLTEPMHSTVAMHIRRDSQHAQSNIDRAIGHYALNQAYYHKLYNEGEVEGNPQVKEYLNKKRSILEENARIIDT
jgi:hypothetical protein